jgi:hypothetical protein
LIEAHLEDFLARDDAFVRRHCVEQAQQKGRLADVQLVA